MSRSPYTAVSLSPGERDVLLRAGRLLTGSWPAAEDLLRRTFAERDRAVRTRAQSTLAIRLRLLTLFIRDAGSSAPPGPEEPLGSRPASEATPPGAPSGEGATPAAPVWHDDVSGVQPVVPLVEALTTLSPRDRALTVGRYYLSLTPAEIGTVIGMPADDVDATAEQILAELRRKTHEVGGPE